MAGSRRRKLPDQIGAERHQQQARRPFGEAQRDRAHSRTGAAGGRSTPGSQVTSWPTTEPIERAMADSD